MVERWFEAPSVPSPILGFGTKYTLSKKGDFKMTSTNKRRHIQLGMSYGTAHHRLRKAIMFQMIQKLGLDICFQCGKKIVTIEELSIEHKISWLDKENAKELFFDLDNIAFSHLSCNTGSRRIPNKGNLKHGAQYAYDRKGCRCELCKEYKSKVNAKRIR